jgi:two-component system chemotaxis response regulator CheY
MRFLVIDDSSGMRRIIVNTLRRLGYPDVIEASGGQEGLARMNEGSVDIVITDWSMPDMTGLELTRTIRATHPAEQVPILMVTGNAARDAIIEAVKSGVNSYVVKPFTQDTLRDKIAAIVGE